MKQKCKFINLRDAITFFPDDKKLLGLANRFHNYQAIRNDLRKAHNLLGEVIRFQNQERLLASPHLFSAGWFYAVILYTRWFKSTGRLIRGRESFSWKIFGADFKHGFTNKVTSFERAAGL